CARRPQALDRNRARPDFAPQDPAHCRRHPGASGRAGATMRRAVLLFALAACSKDNFLDLLIIEPVGDDPLAQAATLRISAGAHTQTVPVTNGHYNVSFTLKTSNPTELEPVSVEALASDGTVVARGKTPLIQLAPSSGQLIVYVARPGSLGSP